MLQNGPHGAASALCHPETFQLARSSSAGPAMWESDEGWNYMKLSYVKDYSRNSDLMHTAPSKMKASQKMPVDFCWFKRLSRRNAAMPRRRDPKHPYWMSCTNSLKIHKVYAYVTYVWCIVMCYSTTYYNAANCCICRLLTSLLRQKSQLNDLWVPRNQWNIRLPGVVPTCWQILPHVCGYNDPTWLSPKPLPSDFSQPSGPMPVESRIRKGCSAYRPLKSIY